MKPFVHSRYRFNVTGLYLANLSAPPILGDEPSTRVMSAGSFLFELGRFGRPLGSEGPVALAAPPAVSVLPPVGSELLAVAVAELNERALFVGLASLCFHSRNLFLVLLASSSRFLTGVIPKDGRGMKFRRRDCVGVGSPIGFLRAPDVSGIDVTVQSIRHIHIITKRIGRQVLAEEVGP